MAMLICEGPCNHNRLEYDAAVKADRRIPVVTEDVVKDGPLSFGPTISNLSGVYVRLGRSLRHTRHQAHTVDHYRCDVCGTVRRFGLTA